MLFAGLLAGCGGSSLEPGTTPLSDGSEISPQRYLADTTGAAEAVSEFWIAAQALGPTPTRAELRAAEPRLALLQSAVVVTASRLRAAQLRDQRLEQQRLRAVQALDPVLRASDQLVASARDELRAAALDARVRLAASIATLRERLGQPAR